MYLVVKVKHYLSSSNQNNVSDNGYVMIWIITNSLITTLFISISTSSVRTKEILQ